MTDLFKKLTTLFAALIFTLIVSLGIGSPTVAFADGGGDPDEFRSSNPKSKSKSKKKKVRKTSKRKIASKKARTKKALRPIRTTRRRQLLVTFDTETSDDAIDAIAVKYGFRKTAETTNTLINQRILKFALKRRLTNTVLQRLTSEPIVTSAQANFLYRLAAQRSVQYASKILQMPAVHAISKGDGITISILDSGVFTNHPAIKGVIADKFDAVGKSGIRNTNHGTGIASIIVAHGKMTGIAPKSRVLSARVFASDRRRGPLVAETYNLMRGIDWAATQRSAVINMSFAGPKDNLFQKAIIAASNKGIALVAAVGNQGSRKPVAFPAAYEQVFAVTATGIKNRLYKFANRGAQVSLAAPGVNILVARRTRSYGLMTGTSVAAAYVSASIALILQQKPDLKAKQAANFLISAATDLGPKGHDKNFGHGLLNIYDAIQANQ